MPKPVLTRKRSWIARMTVLALVFSLMAVALPASAHSVALDTTTPCPTGTPSAGFTDIGGFDAATQTAINCLFAFGITTGTSATTYSPNDTTTRWQMALFLVRQAADHGITIPAAVSQGYTDIGTLPQTTQDAINQITQLGISKGTSSTTFSPFDGVSRWQMALFIYRTGLAAGVTFSSTPLHNDFLDIATLSTEAQTAINALADTRVDPEGHIALGTGLTLFSPNLILVRWQMALFLTRLLAADNVTAPAGLRVTVTPTDAVTLSGGNARSYTATFKNTDGTPYTGAVGITLKTVVSAVVQYDGTPAPTSGFESVSDGLAAVVGAPTPTVQGFPGTDGVVTFLVRHAGATETVVPVAWEDLNNDDDPEITGNTAPTEPHGVGGTVTFSAPAPNAVSGSYVADVTSTNAAADSFTASQAAVDCDGAGSGLAGAACTFHYDSGDLFLVSGVPDTMAGFEAALTGAATAPCRDVVTMTYASGAAAQSTFDITTDNDPCVTVTDPAAATSTTASTYLVKGTAVGGYTVRIYLDDNQNGLVDATDNNGTLDPGEPFQLSGTAAADGTWSLSVNLTSGVANNFIATQRPPGGLTDGPYTDVPTITQGAAAGVTLTSSTSSNGVGSVSTVLDPGDTIVIDFSGAVTGVGSGDTITVVDPDGTSSTITNGTNATFTLDAAADTLTIVITAVLPVSGGSGGIDNVATITAVGGFTSANGVAVNVTGSADRTFSPF